MATYFSNFDSPVDCISNRIYVIPMTQGLRYFCGISTADEMTFDIAYSRLPSENKRRIKKKRRKKKCGEREKRERNIFARKTRRYSEREVTDRNGWPTRGMSQRLIKSTGPEESRARCRGTLVVFASMGKGQQIHWPRETPVSTEVSPRSPSRSLSSPQTASAIVSLRPSQGPTPARARGPYAHCLWQASCFPSNAITRRCQIETNHSICFAVISIWNSMDRQVMSKKVSQLLMDDYFLMLMSVWYT